MTTTKTREKPPKPPKMLHFSPEEANESALAAAIEWSRHYGRLKEIAEAMTEATGEKTTRQMVARWLTPDPEKRMQTSLGNGLMLIHVIEFLSAETPEQKNAASWGGLHIRLGEKLKVTNENSRAKANV